MSWDERLFRLGMRAVDRLRGRGAGAPDGAAWEARLADLDCRLRILASALAGRAIAVREAEAGGGIQGDTLLLPGSMRLAARPEDAELNVRAYVYRVAYALTLRDLGIFLPPGSPDTPEHRALLGLLAAPVVRAELRRRHPPIGELEDQLIEAELARRGEAPGQLASHVLDPARHPKPDWLGAERLPARAEEVAPVALRLLPRLAGLPAADREAECVPRFWSAVYPWTASAADRGAAGAPGDAPAAGTLATGTERRAKPKEAVEEVKFREDRLSENPIVHAFEKLKTADDYLGGRKSLDGSDELEEHLEALEELDLRKVIRTRERTDSVFKADVTLDGGVGDLEESEPPAGRAFLYDEWDAGARSYRKDWCRVYASTAASAPEPGAAEYARAALERNRRQVRELGLQFEQIRLARKWIKRQADGPEIDLDAVVDRHATLQSGHAGSDRLYVARRRLERDFATLVLLDSSLSTDSWIENRRVMDVVKESMLILGAVTEEFRDRLAIGAFFSNTRNDCHYLEVKGFEQGWAGARARLVGLKPTGYTRIGPAIRHGLHLLAGQTARRKLLLLISDGKPTDYDRYEGRYGIEDIAQAVREAGRDQVAVRALAVDVQAKHYLPRMFGTGSYQILPHPGQLASALGKLYGQLR